MAIPAGYGQIRYTAERGGGASMRAALWAILVLLASYGATADEWGSALEELSRFEASKQGFTWSVLAPDESCPSAPRLSVELPSERFSRPLSYVSIVELGAGDSRAQQEKLVVKNEGLIALATGCGVSTVSHPVYLFAAYGKFDPPAFVVRLAPVYGPSS